MKKRHERAIQHAIKALELRAETARITLQSPEILGDNMVMRHYTESIEYHDKEAIEHLKELLQEATHVPEIDIQDEEGDFAE